MLIELCDDMFGDRASEVVLAGLDLGNCVRTQIECEGARGCHPLRPCGVRTREVGATTRAIDRRWVKEWGLALSIGAGAETLDDSAHVTVVE